MRWIIDFEAYQQGSTYFPIEIALLNVETKKCNIFYVGYGFCLKGMEIRYQYTRHGIGWSEGNVKLYNALRAIKKRVDIKHDHIIIKGEQKLNYLIAKGFDPSLFLLIKPEGTPKLNDLEKLVSDDEKCIRHEGTNKHCAMKKCFAILTVVDDVNIYT